jgi:hypothetical protein
MKILTAGDSFTYGEELSDLNSAWPFLLANQLSSTVVNLGQPAASNDCMIRQTMEYLITKQDPIDLVVIGWTSPGRTEFADEVGYYDIWPGYGGNLFIKDGAPWRDNLCKYINQYHNREFYFLKFLQNVILLQNFLESENIKYVMLNVAENDYYKKSPTFFWEKYFEKINKAQFLGFNDSGMMEWTYGCKQGPMGHFLEQGHEIVSNKIYEHIRHLGWIS